MIEIDGLRHRGLEAMSNLPATERETLRRPGAARARTP